MFRDCLKFVPKWEKRKCRTKTWIGMGSCKGSTGNEGRKLGEGWGKTILCDQYSWYWMDF